DDAQGRADRRRAAGGADRLPCGAPLGRRRRRAGTLRLAAGADGRRRRGRHPAQRGGGRPGARSPPADRGEGARRGDRAELLALGAVGQPVRGRGAGRRPRRGQPGLRGALRPGVPHPGRGSRPGNDPRRAAAPARPRRRHRGRHGGQRAPRHRAAADPAAVRPPRPPLRLRRPGGRAV
ncbi:MAG: 2-oxo-4-hydroxy-4-carboxy-5-ureidoimidazoline (OHCU) decarboxylase, partial [uncultured Friedmanniella sp.]